MLSIRNRLCAGSVRDMGGNGAGGGIGGQFHCNSGCRLRGESEIPDWKDNNHLRFSRSIDKGSRDDNAITVDELATVELKANSRRQLPFACSS